MSTDTQIKMDQVPPGGKITGCDMLPPDDDDPRVTKLYKEIQALPIRLVNRLAELLKGPR